ncbi:uncharacterized protein LOC115331738 [Ixodes scapularis]|uniref:uncharacterized protein LOC115331738 n=1 Tax=Ixodes scapularis TaxID=6945 RepID=UPI001C38B2C8|nr:uncharacterized protein LOC115331738 [Ixodes scapularis]
MVEYAKKHFSHPKICYDVLDIAGNGVPDFIRRYGRFDRVYSFFCLNWTNDQVTGFKNIAELLKPGGGCLLLFRASGNLMRLNKKMAAMNHWQKYRKVFENTIPPSADLVHRDALLSYISGLLKNADLTPTTCEVLEEKDVYSSAEEVTRLFTDMSSHSTLVTNEEKLLLHKEVAEEVAKLWADQEAGVAPFRSTVFLVRAQKPRP